MYTITKEKKVIDNQESTTYGIRYNDEYSVPDVSADKAAVERLVGDCNKYGLDPVHLRDVVEDFVAEL